MPEPGNTVFDDKPSEDTAPTARTSLDDWVGEGKKFASVEQLVESYGHAQNHIQTLESSYTGLQEDLNKRLTVEEMLEKIQTPQATQTPSGESQENEQVSSDPDLATLASKLGDQLTEKFETFTSDFQQGRNEEEVSNVLRERFGDEVGTVLKGKAEELGKSVQDLQDMARKDPKLFLGLFPSGAPRATAPNVNSGTVNTDTEQFNQKPQRNWDYWENMRKTDPKAYYMPKNQQLLYSDSLKAGEDFYK